MTETPNEIEREEYKGYTWVDAYLIPDHEVEAYVAERERLATEALDAMKTFCHDARRDWAGSEDGEAILGLDKRGDLIAVIHLDPQSLEEIKAVQKDALIAYLKNINEAR